MSPTRSIALVFVLMLAPLPLMTHTPANAAPAGLRGWNVESDQASAFLGGAVAEVDVNADGYHDVVVGAWAFDTVQGEAAGRAYAYYGSPSGPSTSADWIADGDQAYGYFGVSVADAGDVNGDGYHDVIIGARGYEHGQAGEGRAFVFYGSPSGLSATAAWTAEPDRGDSAFGDSVAGAGDVNGDGYDDVIVGAESYDDGQPSEGAAFVYQGSASGLSATPDWIAESNEALAAFGDSVEGAGDVNADGYDDVIVGATYFSHGEASEGAAFVYQGSATGLSASADWLAEGDQVGANLGYAVAGGGDVNADGYADVVATARYYNGPGYALGAVFGYHGSPAGPSATADWHVVGRQPYESLDAVAAAGDVNGDGYGDVIVGASLLGHPEQDEGMMLVYCGSAGGLPERACHKAESDREQANFANAVAGGGDVDGDGYDDVLVGAPGFSHGQRSEGGAVLLYGSPS